MEKLQKVNIKKMKSLNEFVLVKGYIELTEHISSNGSNYTKLVIEDGSDKIITNLFNSNKIYTKLNGLITGDLIELKIKYNGVNAKGFENYIIEDIEKKEKISNLDCVDIEGLKSELRSTISSMTDQNLKDIVLKTFSNDAVKDKFFEVPATELSGYNFKGGLLAHTVRLCALAKSVVATYNTWDFNKHDKNERVNLDLIITACILQDIGKCEYFRFEGEKIQKTEKAHLFNSAYLGSKIISQLINNSSLTDEQKLILEHNIVSMSSLNTSRTKEGIILQNIRDIEYTMGNFEHMKRINLSGEYQLFKDKEYFLSKF